MASSKVLTVLSGFVLLYQIFLWPLQQQLNEWLLIYDKQHEVSAISYAVEKSCIVAD